MLDSAMMGASLSYNLYFTESTSNDDIAAVSESQRTREVNTIVARQKEQAAETSTTSANGQTVTYGSTSIHRVGEFSTQDKQTNAFLPDDCRIGQAIIPQVIGFNLRPLWDPAIPYEYFMNQNLSNNFREYLFNATTTYLDMANNCLNAAGQNCTANNGTCITVRTQGGKVGYICAVVNAKCTLRPTRAMSAYPSIQNLNEQVNGTYAFTCVNNTASDIDTSATNTSYSFSIYLFNQIYSSDDDEYKDDIYTELYYWPYPTPNYKLQTVKANDAAIDTAPVRTCVS